MEKQKLIRAFICITFPDEVIKEIARVQSLIQKQKFTGKLTELENLHLTLKFLGEIPQEKLEQIKSLLDSINFKPFDAYLEYAGTFSRYGKPSVVWIKVGSQQLLDLQKQIDTILIPLGFVPEKRFMSHLTIARLKYVKDKSGFIDHIKHLAVRQIKFPVNKFELKSSLLRPQGPVYTTLHKFTAQ